MKDKQIIDQLKYAYRDETSENKIRFIRSIKKPNVSLFSFISNQFKLINRKAYIYCFGYFAILLGLLLTSNNTNQYLILSAGIPFFSLIIVAIINASNAYRMQEMEMATLFSLKMVIIARMLIMSILTILLICIMVLCTFRISNISIIRIFCYFFIPYFLNMYVNLKLLRKYRKEGLKYCFVVSTIICLLVLFLADNPNMISLINGNIFVGMLITLIGLSIKESSNYILGLEDYVWIL